MKTESLCRLGVVVTLAAICCFAIWMEHLTPLFADDFSYSVSFLTKQPMHSLPDVIESQKLHYATTNGRAIVHTMAQLIFCGGKQCADIVYALLFGGICLVIGMYCAGSANRLKAWHLSAVFAALWFLTPSFGGSYLWKMGAANYLLSPQLILLFFMPYCNAIAKNCCGSHMMLKTAAMLLFGIVAGWTNENTCLALIAMIIAALLIRLFEKESILPWMISGLMGSCIGAALLFLSPAQAKRLEAAGGMGGIAQWIDRFVDITYNAIRYFWPLMLVGIIMLALIICKLSHRSKLNNEALKLAMVFFVGTIIALYSMVGSPSFPVWAWSSILGFALITVGCMLRSVWPAKDIIVHIGKNAVITVVLLATVAVSYHSVSLELSRIYDMYMAREAYIYEQKQLGEFDITVRGIFTDCTYSSYSLFDELSTDSDSWPNIAIANYYGLDSIALEN